MIDVEMPCLALHIMLLAMSCVYCNVVTYYCKCLSAYALLTDFSQLRMLVEKCDFVCVEVVWATLKEHKTLLNGFLSDLVNVWRLCLASAFLVWFCATIFQR
jgi:hypothetical protein